VPIADLYPDEGHKSPLCRRPPSVRYPAGRESNLFYSGRVL